MLPLTSRTFALSIEALPDDLASSVRVAYLLCRTVDTIEDDPVLPWETRASLFDEFAALVQDDTRSPGTLEQMSAALSSGTDALLCQHSTAVFHCFRDLSPETREKIRPFVLEMTSGMREYAARTATKGRFELRDLPDLERYCYFVAGTVGKLLTALFLTSVPLDTERRQIVEQHDVSFGLGLQLVNIVKDVAADMERGVCFIPRALADAHNVPLARFLDPVFRPQALKVVAELCARAREHLARAEEYTLAWPAKEGLEVRRFCAVPLSLALASLDEVEHGPNALRPGLTPKVSRATVLGTLVATALAIDSDVKLRALFAMARGRHVLHTRVGDIADWLRGHPL